MSDTTAGLLQIGALLAALALCYRPLGDYLARTFTTEKDLRVERVIYRVVGVDPRADQRWQVYATAVVAFSLVGVVLLYALQRFQSDLPLSLGFASVDPALAFNTAASFVTNTNWQAYSGEATMGHLTQMAGLAVQNFVSAAVGIAVAVALIRGFTRSRTDRVGNFWVDLVRITVRVLLPLAVLAAVALIAMGAVQNLRSGTDATTLLGGQPDDHGWPGGVTGGHQGARHQRRRLLQRQLRPPVREPQPAEQPLRDLPAPADPRLPDPQLRRDGRRQAAGLRDPGHDDGAVGHARRGRHRPRGAPLRHRPAGRRRGDGGQGDPLRRVGLGPVRGLDDGYVDGRGRLVPLVVHGGRRRPAAVQHGTRRGRSGRRRLGPLRDAGARDHDRVRGRTDGGPHAGVPAQEDHRPRDQAGLALHPHHAADRAHRDGRRDVVPDPAGLDAQRRPARTLRGALRRSCRRPTTTAPRSRA